MPTTRRILEKMEAGKRYTRPEARQVVEEVASWAERASELSDLLTGLAELDLDLNLSEEMETLTIDDVDYSTVVKAAETLKAAVDSANAAKEALDGFCEAWESAVDPIETWSDEDNEPEELASAKGELEQAVPDVLGKIDELKELGIDITDV
jgi:hypothetical protein